MYVTAGAKASQRYSPSGFFFGVSAIALAINMLFICRILFNGTSIILSWYLLLFFMLPNQQVNLTVLVICSFCRQISFWELVSFFFLSFESTSESHYLNNILVFSFLVFFFIPFKFFLALLSFLLVSFLL